MRVQAFVLGFAALALHAASVRVERGSVDGGNFLPDGTTIPIELGIGWLN